MIINNLTIHTSKTMKRLIFVLSAVALLGWISSCIDPISVNPNYNPEKNSVTTQFVLNIVAESDPKTKQSDSSVQMNGRFRGLDNASLFTFAQTQNGKMVTDTTDQKQYKATGYISLSNALKAGVIDTTGTNADGQSVPRSRRILQIDLPIGTNTLVFYGQAVTGKSRDQLNDYGALGYDTRGIEELDLRKIGCWAKQRIEQGSADDVDFQRFETIFEAILNKMFAVRHTFAKDVDTVKLAGKTVKWADYAVAWDTVNRKPGTSPIAAIVNAGKQPGDEGYLTPSSASPLEVSLSKAYQSFTTVKETEFRAGNAQAIFRQMNDFYAIIAESLHTESTNLLEEVAQAVFSDLREYLDLFFTGVSATSTTLTGWQPITAETGTSVVKSLNSLGFPVVAPSNANYSLGDFPFHFGMPIGATCMKKKDLADTVVFEYYARSGMMLSDGTSISLYDYTYPPSLVYYGNSPIRVSKDANLIADDFKDGATPWETDTWNSKWESGFGAVTSSTRGVAMAYNIQYGNALLETKIKYADAVLGTDAATRGLADNNKRLNGDPKDNVFYPDVVSEGNVYPEIALTGILVAGQPTRVGWNYLATKDASFSRVVYDKRLNSVTGSIDETTGASSYELPIPHTLSGTTANTTVSNYTLLFDNYSPLNANKNKVVVCLEFKNNLGKDFWGQDNMVRDGGTFYLIGNLEIPDNPDFDWNKVSKIMPPYDADGGTCVGDDYLSVFMQDHVSRATFVIGHDSLKKAYVTVPDLRSTSLSFGLSVDLTWDEGINFGEITL